MGEIKKHKGLLFKGARLNFQVFPSLEFSNEDFGSLHLTSCAILKGSLNNVNFYDASFLSTKFTDLHFERCDLKGTDICSIWANNCSFKNTDLSFSTISDSTFIRCTFDAAKFESVSLTHCQFIDCIFEQFPIDNSTFSLNTFTRCDLKNTHFTESFYYQLFEDCTFYKVDLTPSLLGFNYGFSPELISQLCNNIDLDKISTTFINKKLYVNAAILRINQIQNYYDDAMVACAVALSQMMQYDILIKADEIEFLKTLTTYFYGKKLIAPISIVHIWQTLNSHLISNAINTAVSKALPYIREYINMLYFSFLDFQRSLQTSLEQLPSGNGILETAELKIVYSKEPTFPLLCCLTEFETLIGRDCPTPYLIRTEKGSYLEYHEIALAIIPYLQTLFSFLNIIVPIVIYNKQKKQQGKEGEKKDTTKVKSAEKKKDIAEQTDKEVEITLSTTKPKIVMPNTTIIAPQTNAVISDVIKVIESQPILSGTGFCGYNNQNIQSITVRFH